MGFVPTLMVLAWRNLWRNQRRTWITVASIAFAVVLVVFSRSATTGVYDYMTDNIVRFSSGYIQVHQRGYWDEQVVDNCFEADPALDSFLVRQPEVTLISHRFQAFSLVSSGEYTSGVLVMGIDPEAENNMSKLAGKVIAGSLFGIRDTGVLVGEGLAKKLRIGLGDTLLLLSQGYHGSGAYARIPVTGIARYPSQELDRSLVYLPLPLGQGIFDVGNRLSAISILVDQPRHLPGILEKLRQQVDTTRYEVMDWKTMLPEIDQVIEADRGGHMINAYVLYAVVAFGIFGTILMMMSERRYELGILMAIGMRRGRMMFMVTMEILWMALVGVCTGLLMALPVVVWFHIHPLQFSGDIAEVYRSYGFEPIMPTVVDPGIFFSEGMIVFYIAMALSLYPVYYIRKLREVSAMRS